VTPDERDGELDRLVEVAVALPVPGTFTYRDPRPGAVLPAGSQVVVPFRGRTVTGFVLGPATLSGEGGAAEISARDIEAVVAGVPALDDEMLSLCRWAADYYQAPLGEMLRAGLPQGERATAIRSVRLTASGERIARGDDPPRSPESRTSELRASATVTPLGESRVLAAQVSWLAPEEGAAMPVESAHPILRALLEARGELPLRGIHKRFPGSNTVLRKLEAAGWVETGDAVRDRRREPTETFVVPGQPPGKPAPRSPRASRRQDIVARVNAAGAPGIALADFSAGERAQVHVMARAGQLRLDKRPAPASASTEHRLGAGSPPDGAVASARGPAPTPTAAQGEAIAQICASLGHGYSTFLLHGVTGSGKTEVYLRVIAEVRAMGRGALVLVPEIALTPQLAARFRARFGDDVAVLHSGLPPRERLAAWRRLRAGEVGIALGARSAVFAPVRALGVVVVDEEHDSSFKQEDGVRYNGRDLAVVRAQRMGAVAVLGSATPSLESFRNAEIGRYRRLALPHRATPRPLPPVEIIDLRRSSAGPDGLLSPPLAEAIATNLAAGQQTILFLNRRGFSTFVLCRACGHAVRCAHCSVSMTYHRGRDRLVCHYCGSQTVVPGVCPACHEPKLERLGAGTERAEAIVRDRFPGARVARLDRDTAGASGVDEGSTGLDDVLRGMNSGETDILIGTQMVTKGHDFGGVTLVGVLHPDQSMHLPDFRATERVFQLLEQVAGRAGRGDRPGRVMIQTYLPEHPAVSAVTTHDYAGFARAELRVRQEFGYPPFSRMTVLRLDATDEAAVRAAATTVAEVAGRAGGPALMVRGPAPAPIARIRGRSRFQVWLSSPERPPLVAAMKAAMSVKLERDIRLVVDVDPQSSL
jgi:primosomal protein N' (replication factor Y)